MAEDKEPILIDCPHCADRVQASPARPWLDHQYEYRIGIVQCLKCFNPLVAHQDFLGPQGPTRDRGVFGGSAVVAVSRDSTLVTHSRDDPSVPERTSRSRRSITPVKRNVTAQGVRRCKGLLSASSPGGKLQPGENVCVQLCFSHCWQALWHRLRRPAGKS